MRKLWPFLIVTLGALGIAIYGKGMSLEMVEAATKHGLGIVLAIGVFWLLGRVLHTIISFLLEKVVTHVMEQADAILKMSTAQNESWQRVIDESTSQMKRYFEENARAHGYQREEHKEGNSHQVKICETLDNLCKNTSVMSEQGVQNVKAMGEINASLVRINGYTHSKNRKKSLGKGK